MNETHDSNVLDAEERQGTIFLHDITKLDCAIFDPSKGVIGQSWFVDLSVTGPLDDRGFVYDFSTLKKMVRQVMKTTLDHALVIPINSQAVQYWDSERGECWRLKARPTRASIDAEWEYKCPSGAVFPSRSVALSRQTLEQEFARSLRHRLPTELTSLTVTLREEELDPTEAVFRYTHGICRHEGLCQRLFHGHRSRIQIFVNDERRPDLEHWVVHDVLDSNVHIACPSQFKVGSIEPGTRGKTRELVTLAYVGSQGAFEASIPADRVFCVEHETSIECITLELARLVKREEKTLDKVKVVCCEGIDKGAIAEV